MIGSVTQIEPVTNLQRGYTAMLEKLVNGPLFLTLRGRAAAVLLSVEDFDRQRQELAFYRRQVLADQAMADIEAGNYVTGEEFEKELAKMGIE